jgi:agmatinase
MKKEFRDLLVENEEEANIFLVGVPFDKNASVGKGAAKAPDVIRALSYDLPAYDMRGNALRDVKLFDFGDFSGDYFEQLTKDFSEKFFTKDAFKIILGGDHSIAIASEKAFLLQAKKDDKTPVIIHLDAHPDFCKTYEGSEYSHACPIYKAIENGYEDKNVTLVGIRGFEAQEVERFKRHPLMDVFKTVDIKTLGADYFVELMSKKYASDDYEIYLSYDIDANDPSFAPGTGTPEAFGLSSVETLTIVTGLIASLNVKAMDIVEVAPPLDINNITSRLAIKTMYEVFNTLIQTGKIKNK